MNNKLKILELFAGIGATTKALSNLGIDHESTFIEFDPKVVEISNLLNDRNDKPIDVRTFNASKGDFDLIVGGFPCQDVSAAGKNLGIEGERTILFREALRIIKQVEPTYIILENVKNILSQKHIHIVEEIKQILQEMNYKIDIRIVNAKLFIPQNRERVFILATKKDFNEVEIPLRETVLMHYLENIYVSPSYDLTEGQLQNLKINFNKLEEEDINNIIKVGNCSKSNHRGLNIYSAKGILPTFTENHGASIKIIYEIPGVIPEGNYYSEEKLEKILNWKAQEKPLSKVAHPNSFYVKTLTTRTQPGTASDQMVVDEVGKINTNDNYINLEKELLNNKNSIPGFINNYKQDNIFFGIGATDIATLTSVGSFSHHRILEKLFPFRLRSITPRESMRLMGWVDKDIDKIIHLSKGKIYKVAGNSMVVQVMEHNLKRLGLKEIIDYWWLKD